MSDWKKYFDIWASQGRTEEQKWAVENFLTGQGAIMLDEARKAGQREMIENVGNKVLADVQEGVDGNPEWYRAMNYVEGQLDKLKSELAEEAVVSRGRT